MIWTRTSLALTIFLIPVGSLSVIVAIACILAYFNPYCHFTWRCGKCWEIDGVGRRASRSYRPNEQTPENTRTIKMHPRRPAPEPPAQALIPGSPQTVEVHIEVENIEIQIEPQENNEMKKDTALLLTDQDEGEGSGL